MFGERPEGIVSRFGKCHQFSSLRFVTSQSCELWGQNEEICAWNCAALSIILSKFQSLVRLKIKGPCFLNVHLCGHANVSFLIRLFPSHLFTM